MWTFLRSMWLILPNLRSFERLDLATLSFANPKRKISSGEQLTWDLVPDQGVENWHLLMWKTWAVDFVHRKGTFSDCQDKSDRTG